MPETSKKTKKEAEETNSSRSGLCHGNFYSLGRVSSTWCSVVVTVLILLSHGLFLWGLLDPLWALYAQAGYNITVVSSVNSTNEANEVLFQILGFDNVTTHSISKELSILISAFDYADGIRELYQTPYWLSKLSAVLLLLFSAIWPHLKLALLHCYYYLKVPADSRRSALYWLSTFGKWSLADICVVCFLFVILDIGIDVNNLSQLAAASEQFVLAFTNSSSLEQLSEKAENKLDTFANNNVDVFIDELANILIANNDTKLWNAALASACGTFYTNETCPEESYPPNDSIKGGLSGIIAYCLNPFHARGQCQRCECIVTNILFNDNKIREAGVDKIVSVVFAKLLLLGRGLLSSLDIQGDAYVRLHVQAYPALLGFAGAVIISIVSGILVDNLEEKQRMRINQVDLHEQLLCKNTGETTKRSFIVTKEYHTWDNVCFAAVTVLLVLSILPLMISGMFLPSFDWVIGGIIPEILELQVEPIEKQLSLVTLTGYIGTETIENVLFMIIFGFFIIGTPFLRAACLTVLGLFPLNSVTQFYLAHISNISGAFIGLEPLFVCLVIIMAELPVLTNTIVPSQSCDEIKSSAIVESFFADQDSCFFMNFSLLPLSALLILAWIFMTFANALIWGRVMHLYSPFGDSEDGGGPYCDCRRCCNCKCYSADAGSFSCNTDNENSGVHGDSNLQVCKMPDSTEIDTNAEIEGKVITLT